MKTYEELFANNKAWAEGMRRADPTYFERRAQGQEPNFLFIGCCDSRVPTEMLTASKPGEIFTHRNIANQAHPNDLSMLSALEYAIEFLDVKHVLVCGLSQVQFVSVDHTVPLSDHFFNYRIGTSWLCVQ